MPYHFHCICGVYLCIKYKRIMKNVTTVPTYHYINMSQCYTNITVQQQQR